MGIRNESIIYNSVPSFRVTAHSVGAALVTTYLDLDGVIYPIEPADYLSAGVDGEDIEMRRDNNNLEWWHTKIVERIGRLPLEIVMSSSWGEAFMLDAVRSPRAVLAPTRALSGRTIRVTSKLAAIVHDIIESPTKPFVILEDTLEIEETVNVLGDGMPYLLIRPDSMLGMTHELVDALEEFVDDMQSRTIP